MVSQQASRGLLKTRFLGPPGASWGRPGGLLAVSGAVFRRKARRASLRSLFERFWGIPELSTGPSQPVFFSEAGVLYQSSNGKCETNPIATPPKEEITGIRSAPSCYLSILGTRFTRACSPWI